MDRELAELLIRHGWEPAPSVSWPEDTDMTSASAGRSAEDEYDLPVPMVVRKRRRRVPQAGPDLFTSTEAAHA